MKRSLCLAAGALLSAAAALAQFPPINLPQSSPRASVSQTVGVTELAVSYHRPAVNKRKIWGDLVPYDQVWRAGANENTTLSFSTPATVGGKALPAGTYGLHMIPTQKDWTIIISNVSDAWGTFYEEKNDAARFTATPRSASLEERLSYRFDDPTRDSTTLVMAWENLEVPIPIQVDTKAGVVASLKGQLRGLPQFGWQGWNTAANFCVQNDYALDQGLEWADRSIAVQETFANLRTKAAILEKKGDAAQAQTLRDKSLKIANEADMNAYGYQLIGQKKVDEAIAVFQKNVKDYPASWNTYDSLGEAYEAKGDKKKAIELYSKALAMTQDPTQKKRIEGILQKLKA